jgi:hypothetical protein
VNTHYLDSFLKKSLKQDNIDGVAYLVNYCKSLEISTADLSVNSFRPALDYYMNKNFNLSKVMTFLKLYSTFCADRAEQVLSEEIAQEEMASVADQIFGKTDDLVDLDALANYLVQQAGERQILDPLTKEDGLWNLIDTFT